jgi:hypothetical protein
MYGERFDALRFWAIALAGLVAAPLIGLGMRALLVSAMIAEAGDRAARRFLDFFAASVWWRRATTSLWW